MGKTLVPKSFKAQIERALHNLYQEKSTTLHPMTLIPIYYRRMFKGDRFDFGVIESILRSEPTFAPLLSNWRLQFEWYFDSDANRYGWIDNNNRLSAEEVIDRKHHTFDLSKNHSVIVGMDYDLNAVSNFVARGSVMDYAGFAPGTTVVRDGELSNFDGIINIDFHLTYLNIIRNYHCNNQFPFVPYISDASGTADFISYNSYPREDMDNLFMFLRSCPNGVRFARGSIDAPSDLLNYYRDSVLRFMTYLDNSCSPSGGIFCAEYEPDLYQNLLSKDQQLLRSIVSTETIDGTIGITIEQFRLKNHLQDLYDRIFVSGGTERDLSRTLWGIESNRDYDIPELLCVHSEIIGTNLVTSSTAGSADYNGENVSNAPGSMSGNINMRRGSSRTQRFTANTSGSLMCIVSLVPLVTYNENIERHLLEHNFMDEFTPQMARKGFENVPLSDYTALPPRSVTDDGQSVKINDINVVVGKQVAWLREMTAVNRCHGEFSNGGQNYDWLLHRTFMRKTSRSIVEPFISPYGLPDEFQYPFVSTDLLSPNFNLQVAFKCDAYRPIPRKFMPTLGN